MLSDFVCLQDYIVVNKLAFSEQRENNNSFVLFLKSLYTALKFVMQAYRKEAMRNGQVYQRHIQFG